MRRSFWLASALAASLCPSAGAYIRSVFNFSDGSVVNSRRIDNAAIQFYLNNQVAAGAQSTAPGVSGTVITAGSDPVSAIQSALATWNGIPGANLKFLPLKSTDKGADTRDKQMTIVIGSTAADVSAVGGALAVTSVQSAPFAVGDDNGKGIIDDTDIILNPAMKFSTDGSANTADLQAVVTHELGHSLGLNHSGIIGAVMFQFASLNQRYLSADETGFAASVYPGPGSSVGTLQGKVITSDGSPVGYGLVEFIDQNSGAALSALTGADGAYSIQAAPGEYIMYAEPVTSNSLVQAGNLYLLSSAKVTTNFQATMLGGFGSPAKITLAAGAAPAIGDLKVTAGASSLSFPYTGIATSNSFSAGNTATLVPSGQTIDLLLIGGGIDGTITVQAFGRGVTVKAVKADNNIKSSAGNAVRVTVDLAPLSAPSLATLIITKGSSVYSVSGGFVIGPPQPTFVTAAVDSAASAQYLGAVSPGGITAIYDIPGAPNLGPAAAVVNGGYDAYGKLPVNLAGVTVTFDGVPAPLFFVSGGQINLQVPFEVAGKTSTRVVVNYLGSGSTAVTVPVTAAQPAFFMLSATDPFAANSDFASNPTPNSAGNPAARGTVFSVYGTGVGKLPNYDATTGAGSSGPASGFRSQYNCTLGGKTFDVFGGWTPTAVGLSQWSFSIPPDSATGAVSIKCTDSVSGASTQTATVYIK